MITMKPHPFDTKIINPLLKAASFAPEDEKIIREELLRLILTEALLSVGQKMPKEEIKKLETELNQGKNLQEKFSLLQKGLAASPSAQEALKEYFENQLPKLLQELLTAFMAKASSEQKQKLLKLMKEA